MKWVKHYCDLSSRLEFSALLQSQGPKGYGIFWICLEQIGRQFTGDPDKDENWLNGNLFGAIARFACCTEEEVAAVFQKSVDLGILKLKKLGRIDYYYCPMMQEMADEYTNWKRKNGRGVSK